MNKATTHNHACNTSGGGVNARTDSAGDPTIEVSCGTSNAAIILKVIEVESLKPDIGDEIDKKDEEDDEDPDTRTFVVADADTGVVTVTATPNPNVADAMLLPGGWTLTGGTGTGKLSRTINLTKPDIYELTCTCGTSQKKTKVIVAKVELIEASSPIANNSPQQFEGCQSQPFIPTDSANPGNHLVIFYKDAVSANLVVNDFNVDLRSQVLPPSVTSSMLPESWIKDSGPDSGVLNPTTTFNVQYQNSRLGAVYKIKFRLGLEGSADSEANVVLPLAGSEVDSIIKADIIKADAFAVAVIANYNWLERQLPTNGIKWFVNNGNGDYLGRPDNSSSPTVRKYNQVSTNSPTYGMGVVATWKGVPIRVAKISNFIVAYGANKIGVRPVFAWMPQIVGTFNDSSASKSWDAGWKIAGGFPYESTVRRLVQDVFDEADDKNRKLWPNPSNADNYVPPAFFSNPDNEFCSLGFLYFTTP